VGRGKIPQQFAEALQSLAASTNGSFVHARPDRLALADAIDQIYLGLLETRSFVVSFMYERDDAGQMMQNAAIEVQRPGQELLLSANLSNEIPRLKEKPLIEPPKRNRFWLVWLLLAVFLGLGFFILSNRRRQKELGTELRQWEEPVGPVEPEVSVPRAREPTVVGGYSFPVPGPEQPTAILTAVSGPLEGQQFSVKKEIFHIGVSPKNDLCIAADDYVSENHASLRYEKGNLFIFDRGSKNGTFVNKNKVSDTGLALNLGDRIEVGMSTFEVARAPSSGRAETPLR